MKFHYCHNKSPIAGSCVTHKLTLVTLMTPKVLFSPLNTFKVCLHTISFNASLPLLPQSSKLCFTKNFCDYFCHSPSKLLVQLILTFMICHYLFFVKFNFLLLSCLSLFQLHVQPTTFIFTALNTPRMKTTIQFSYLHNPIKGFVCRFFVTDGVATNVVSIVDLMQNHVCPCGVSAVSQTAVCALNHLPPPL